MFRALVVLLCLWLPAAGSAQTVEPLSFPQHYSIYTNDFAEILTDEAEARINAVLEQARAERDLEMTVVTIRSRDDYAPSTDIVSFSKALFNGWGIGNKERNDGILLLVAIEDREMRIALGAGYPARQDGIAARIIQTQIIPAFRDGRIADGIFAGTQAAISQLTVPTTSAPQPQVRAPEPAQITPEQPPLVREVSLPKRISQWIGRTVDGASDNPIAALIIAALTAVGGFFGVRGIQQHRPRKCPECGRVMLRLGQAQEDQYLDHGQIIEERMQSKDYGVWFCTHDEHVTVIGYPSLFKRRKACRECGYHTLETSRVVTMPATTAANGQARLNHSCQNCHQSYSEFQTLAKINQSSSSSSGRSGFSSSSSSSFGGGSSSGGGASGSW